MKRVTSTGSNSSDHYPRSESRSLSPTTKAQQQVNESSNNDAIISEITGIIRDNSQEIAATIILAIIQKMESVENLEFFYRNTMRIITKNLTKFNGAIQILAIKTAYQERKKLLSEKLTSQLANDPSNSKENHIGGVPAPQFRSQSLRSSRSAINLGRRQRSLDKPSPQKSWIQSLRSPQSTVNQNRQRSSSVTTGGNQPGFFNSAPIIDTIYSRPSQGCPKICSVM